MGLVVKLVFGVIEVPYAYDGAKKRRKRPKGMSAADWKRLKEKSLSARRAISTGDVAGFLEDRYRIMEVFYHAHEKPILGMLEDAMRGRLEDILMGAPVNTTDPTLEGISAIEARFKKFIAEREIETFGIPGVPTQAALKGVSHRHKKKTTGKLRRPSFIDTGLYLQSFKAWVE
jgi:hypothetical protein